MENSLKGLLLAAGTIVTCIIIGLGFFIAREARDTAAGGAGEISKLNAEFEESDKVMYDGLSVSGSEVVNVINKFRNEEICIRVKTKKGTFQYNYTISGNEDSPSLGGASGTSVKDAQKTTSNNYINPNAQFQGSIIRDINNTIIGLSFQQAA